MNDIVQIQNEEPQLKLLRARSQTYRRATALMLAQLALTLGTPTLGSIAGTICSDAKAYVAAISLIVIFVDAIIVDRFQKKLIKRAAKIGEQFDCRVLDLRWDHFTAGDRVDPEDIHAAAKAFAARKNDDELRNWYPIAVGAAPLHLARLICQRTNLHYDSRLRLSYRTIVVLVSFCVFCGLFALSLGANASMTTWVLTMVPATPFLAWAVREYYRQTDTAGQLDTLKIQVKELWETAIAGNCTPEICGTKSREFQNAIYNRRANSPLIFPLLYKFRRLALEDEMNEGATEMLRDLGAEHSGAKSNC